MYIGVNNERSIMARHEMETWTTAALIAWAVDNQIDDGQRDNAYEILTARHGARKTMRLVYLAGHEAGVVAAGGDGWTPED